jgi:hypothetical protein
VINKKNKTITDKSFEFRDYVIKKKLGNSKPIKTNYFLDPKYSCISAVVYSYANVTDSISDSGLGRDFFIIHNPLATNKLPLGSFKCGTEYCVNVDDEFISILIVENEKEDKQRSTGI